MISDFIFKLLFFVAAGLWIYLIVCLVKASYLFNMNNNKGFNFSPLFIFPRFQQTEIGKVWADRFWKTLIAIVLLCFILFWLIYANEY